MTRSILIVLTFFAAMLIFIVAIFISREQTMPDNARVALDKYLQYRYSLSELPIAIQQSTRATLPSKFSREMSGTSFSDSIFFQTMVNYRTTRIANLPNLATVTPGALTADYGSGSALIPFPPQDVWCVSLNDANQTTQVIFVALHQGLYNSDWLVHEPPGDWSIAELSQNLSGIGCDLKLKPGRD